MSDLIVCINIDESRRKKHFIVETYEGAIPNLKSQKYSGQLRNTDVMFTNAYANIDQSGIESIRKILNLQPNIQISKYQYIIHYNNIESFFSLLGYGCVFYKEKKTAMYRVTEYIHDNDIGKDYYEIEGLRFKGKKTTFYYAQTGIVNTKTKSEVIAKAYVDLNDKNHRLELLFDYENSIINYTEKERVLDGSGLFRDYGFETQIISSIEAHNWVFHKATGFEYAGKKLPADLIGLVNDGISVFTNNKKRIALADFSNIKVSYDIDWFSIRGSVSVDGESVNIANLFDLKKGHDTWVEYNGKVVFLPEALNDKSIKNTNGDVTFDKKQVVKAISIAKNINGSPVRKLEELIDYSQIQLEIESLLASVLRPYQEDGIKWLLSLKRNNFGGCLADDMGLGKTLQVICYLNDKKCKEDKSLIVVPKTLLANWGREFSKYDPEQKIYVYHGTNRSFEAANKANVIISTYQTVLNDLNVFEEVKFDNLIIDEAQYIKNSKSKAHRAMRCLHAKTKLLLTGTPIENNLEEYWGLMRLINPDIMDSYTSVCKQSDNLIQHIRLITAPFLLRRLKSNVLNDLPDKQEQTVYVQMEDLQLELYNKMLESIKYEITRKSDRYEIKSNSIMLNGLLYLQEICCHPALLNKELNPGGCKQSAKLDLLIQMLSTLYETNHKVVVFSRFTHMLKIIEKKLKTMNYKSFYLDGKTSNRMNIVDDFENSNEGIFLISLKAGGTGINLVSADTAIIYDPWWNPASEKQAEDRIYRIGQTKKVTIFRLIVSDSIEEKVQNLQNEKKEMCSQILEGHEMPIRLTADLLKELLL